MLPAERPLTDADTGRQARPTGSAASAAEPAPVALRDPKIDQDELFIAWRRDRDRAAQELLIERYMPLARSLARRYGRTSEPFEDLLQVASLGLVKAINRYELERGHSFAAFAVPTILGEMRRHFRDAGWAIHVPRAAKERALAVRDAVDHLRGTSGHSPTANQLAEFLELDVEQVLDALAALRGVRDLLPGGSPRRRGRRGRQLCGDAGRGGRALRADRV